MRDHDWGAPVELDLAELGPSGQAELARLAEVHGVGSCVHVALGDHPDLEPMVASTLDEIYHAATNVHMRALLDLGTLGEALADVDIDWACCKGPVLSEHVYTRADLRTYSDLDVLVRSDELRAAVAALERAGAELLDRNWGLIRSRMSGEVHLRLPAGTLVDLHWHLFNRPEIRRAFEVPTDRVLDRAIDVELDGTPARALDPADALVHLAVHACMAGGCQLLWCKDIEQSALQAGVDWDGCIERAHEWRAGLPVALMLASSAAALGAPVPDWVPPALAPRRLWRRLGSLADRWQPIQQWSGGRSLHRDLCVATRDGDTSSMAALARRTGSLARKRDAGRPRQPDRDASHASSLLHPGSDADRHAFFTAIEGTDRD